MDPMDFHDVPKPRRMDLMIAVGELAVSERLSEPDLEKIGV